MKPFRINRNGQLVFPSSVFVDLDFSVIRDLEHLQAVVHRDFEVKAPTGTEIAAWAAEGRYQNRAELMRDIGLHLFWASRFALTMYDKRPTRWRDVPRNRDDVFVPLLRPWEDRDKKVASVRSAYQALPARWDEAEEDALFRLLFDLFSTKLYHATELPPIKPTIAEALATPGAATTVLGAYDPDHPRYPVEEIVDVAKGVPELESLWRWAMVLHNQHPWDRSQAALKPLTEFEDDDVVVVFHPKNRDVLDFINRVRDTKAPASTRAPQAEPAELADPVSPLPPLMVGGRRDRGVKVEALAVRRGEVVCSNDDVIRNAPPSWSAMTSHEIADKTGIEQRCYTAEPLENIALEAAEAALAHAGRRPEEIGAVLFCSCTTNRLIPSTACWISGQLGIGQTHASADIIAACAGFPYGMAEAVRLLDEVDRPVLVVLAEKFSDKIGNARPSRMIFGDGAAAMVVSPAPDRGDVEVVQTYASGPASQVNSIIWPNPDFDNDVTVYGPEVKAMVHRYLNQMIGELAELDGVRSPGDGSSLLDDLDAIVPHQANRTMIVDIADAQGVPVDKLYFNIARVGNVSAASIPLALADAVFDGDLDQRSLVFAPGFGAGAVGGYVVLWVEPSMIAPEQPEDRLVGAGVSGAGAAGERI